MSPKTRSAAPGGAVRALVALERVFEGGGFPVFVLCVLAFYELVLVGLLLAPGGQSGLGAFADDFRIWCFGYDPATGRIEPGYVLGMTAPPLLLGTLATLLWWEPLRAYLAHPRALVTPVLAAVVVVGGAAGALAAIGVTPQSGELPFPAEELRTAHRAPALRLTDQGGEPLELAALRGRVVLLTAVYASCPHACPLILAQTERALAALGPEQRAELRVVAVTMDPEVDTPERLAELAGLHDLHSPLYSLVTGEPAEVNRVLDDMGIARQRDPETGIIDHANLFLLLDRRGDVAYRLTLGERQERWLVSALRLLLREPGEGG